MMSPHRVGPVDDPLELERERAANCLESLGVSAETFAAMMERTPGASPWLRDFAANLSRHAADLRRRSAALRGMQEPSAPAGHRLRLVK